MINRQSPLFVRKFHLTVLSLCIACLFVPIVTNASIPAPRLKPAVTNISSVLDSRDAANFRQGMRALDKRKWADVKSRYRRLSDPTAKNILKWRQAISDPEVSFATLTDVIHNQSDWPRMTAIKAKAEGMLFDRPLSPEKTIHWFMGQEPVSGEGRAAMAQAYYKLGNNEIGDRWLRLAWRESRLTRDRQKRIYSRYKSKLTEADHAARADHLIWLGRRYHSTAGGLLGLMSKSDRALMDARMRVASNKSGMDAAINAVPADLKDDAGLLYERARWRRKRKSEIYALPVYLQIVTPPKTETGRKRLWREKKLMTYWALKEKRFQDAYELTLNHGMTSGVDFSEAEFLAGWIALTKNNKPEVAARHFKTLKGGVSLPVSLGRASYWQGRAAEATNDVSSVIYYSEAAKYPNVYYGQLAAEKVNQGYAYISLPPEEMGDDIRGHFDGNELIRALKMIGEIQNERVYNWFSFHLDDVFDDKRELSLLAQLNKDFGYMKPSVRAAKQAGRLDTMLTESGYPMPDVFIALSNRFDIPFSLAVARQESEFNTRAASHASAYGMMQMINATARATARKAKLPYKKSWLMSDPEYAAKLGSHHLEDLLDDFGGSYIMAAAAYNAGPRRVAQWNKAFGDPRKGEIDPIDWIESIPFSETRNYVQRVMENMEVYRARLNSNQAELRLAQNLTRGAYR
jgi:soluble lytic murein transglycosylase